MGFVGKNEWDKPKKLHAFADNRLNEITKSVTTRFSQQPPEKKKNVSKFSPRLKQYLKLKISLQFTISNINFLFIHFL